MLEFDTLLPELVLHGLALALLGLLLFGHVALELLVLLRQLHVLLHGLVEQLELAVKVAGALGAQTSLLRRALHLLVVDGQISDDLLDTLLLSGRVVGLWRERLSALGLFRLEEGALGSRLLLRLEVLADLTWRLDLGGGTLTLGSLLVGRLLHKLDGLANDLGLLVFTQLVLHVLLAFSGGHFPVITHFLLQTLTHVVHALLHADLAGELVPDTGLVRRDLLVHRLGARLAGRLLRGLHCRRLFHF